MYLPYLVIEGAVGCCVYQRLCKHACAYRMSRNSMNSRPAWRQNLRSNSLPPPPRRCQYGNERSLPMVAFRRWVCVGGLTLSLGVVYHAMADSPEKPSLFR